jgi:hypothetical protein
MHEDPRFWALFAAIWIGGALAALNLVTKVNMLMSLASY